MGFLLEGCFKAPQPSQTSSTCFELLQQCCWGSAGDSCASPSFRGLLLLLLLPPNGPEASSSSPTRDGAALPPTGTSQAASWPGLAVGPTFGKTSFPLTRMFYSSGGHEHITAFNFEGEKTEDKRRISPRASWILVSLRLVSSSAKEEEEGILRRLSSQDLANMAWRPASLIQQGGKEGQEWGGRPWDGSAPPVTPGPGWGME